MFIRTGLTSPMELLRRLRHRTLLVGLLAQVRILSQRQPQVRFPPAPRHRHRLSDRVQHQDSESQPLDSLQTQHKQRQLSVNLRIQDKPRQLSVNHQIQDKVRRLSERPQVLVRSRRLLVNHQHLVGLGPLGNPPSGHLVLGSRQCQEQEARLDRPAVWAKGLPLDSPLHQALHLDSA